MGIWQKVVDLVRASEKAIIPPPTAWLEGEKADRATDNPYKPWSAEYVDWMEGFDSGHVSKDAW